MTYGQRYHFVAGWLPWLSDGLNLLFTLAALLWSVGMVHFPLTFEPPLIIISMIPISFFAFKLAKLLYLYQRRVDPSLMQTLASAFAGLSLTHTIAKAVLYGFVTRDLPFFRTPKKAAGSTFWCALRAAREEGFMAVALLLAIQGIVVQQGTDSPDLLFWVTVLLIQSIPYLAAVAVSFIAAGAHVPDRLIAGITEPLNDEAGPKVQVRGFLSLRRHPTGKV